MTQVASAQVIINAQTAQAQRQIRQFLAQTRTALTPLSVIKPVISSAPALAEIRKLAASAKAGLGSLTITPKVRSADMLRELKRALSTVNPVVSTTVKLRPLTQSQLSAAAQGLSVAVPIKVKPLSQAALNAAIGSNITANLGLSFKRPTQTQINAALTGMAGLISLKVRPVTQAQVNAALKGVTGTKDIQVNIKGDAATKLSALNAQINKLKATASTAVVVNASAVTALITQLTTQITALKAIEASLKGLRLGGNPGPGNPPNGPPGARGGVSVNTGQLLAQLEQVNNAYKRGELSQQAYENRLKSLDVQFRIAARSAQQGTAEFKALDGATTRVSNSIRGIRAAEITKLKTELSGARAQFDAAAGAAQTLGQKRAAIAAYQRDLVGIEQGLRNMAASGKLTVTQMNAVQQSLGRIARERTTLDGRVNLAGLSGNVANALRGLPGVLGSLGGPLGAAAGQAGALGGGLASILKNAGPVGIAVGVAAIALGGLILALKGSIDTAAQFEQTLADIRALTQPTAADLTKLQTAAIQLGKPLGVGAREGASALLELNRAGLTTKDTLEGGLKGTLDLAGAAGIKAADAAIIAASAMTAFGLAGRNIPEVADVFANFANKTFLGAQDLQLAIAATGPVARSSGIDLAQFGGIMATLAQGGFKNMSDAGTSLKTMLLSLQSPTADGSKYLKAIGVDVYDSAGKLKPFTETIGNLREKLIKLNPEAQKKVMREIFGQDAIRAAEILLRVGPKALDANTAAMRKQGEAARVAKERLESLQGAGKQFGATFEELKIKIGSPFLGALAAIVRGATGAVQGLLNLSTGAGATGLAFGQMGESSRQSLQALSNVIKVVFSGIAAAYNTVLKPVLIVLGQAFSVISTAVSVAFTIILNVITGVFRAASGIFTGFVSAFTGNSNAVKFNLGDMAAKFGQFAEVARAYLVAVGKVAGQLPDAFATVGGSIGKVFAGVAKIFSGFALTVYDYLVKPVLPVLGVIKDAFVGVGTFIGNSIVSLVTFVAARLRPLADVLKALGVGLAETLANVLDGVVGGVRRAIGSAADDAQAQATQKAAAAAESGARKASGGLTLIKDGVADVKSGVTGLGGAVTTFGKNAAATFNAVPAQLAKAREEAARLRAELSSPLKTQALGAATAPGVLASGSTTLAELEALAAKNGKARKTVTPEEINALEAYKQKLKGLNAEQLKAEVLTQTKLKDTARLRLAIAALNAETNGQTAASKRAAAADSAAEKSRSALVLRIRQSIEKFNDLAEAGKVTVSARTAFTQQFARFAADAQKLPEAQQRGIRGLFEQAKALAVSTDGQVRLNAAQRDGSAARENLVRQTRQAIAQLKLLNEGGKATAQQALSQRQKIDDLAAAANRLPVAQRAGLQPLFTQAGALLAVTDAQAKANAAAKAGAQASRNQGIALQDFRASLKGASTQRLIDLEIETRQLKQTAAHGAVIAEQARRVAALAAEEKKAAAERKRAAAEDARNTGAAGSLTRDIGQVSAAFNLQATQGKTTEASLLSYQQRLEDLGERIKALPEAYRENALAALAAAQGLAAFGRSVVNRNSELSKLKESVGGLDFTQLTEALARVNAAGGDPEKLAILQKEIDKRKTLTGAVLDQVEAEGRLSQARADAQSIEADFSLDTGAAEGDLAQLYALELAYGARIQAARDEAATEGGRSNEIQIRAKYAKLYELEGLSAQQRIQLDNALTAELRANSDAVLATVAGNAAARLAAEVRAKQALDSELLRVDRTTRAAMTQLALSAASKLSSDAEAELNEALAGEELTANARLQIRLKAQPALLAAKAREVALSRQIDEQAEADRYADALEAARKNGTAQQIITRTGLTVEQTLTQQHSAALLAIGKGRTDELRAYELQVKRDTGKSVIASDKEIAASRKTDAQARIDAELENLDTFTEAQRVNAVRVFSELIQIYKSMLGPGLSAGAVEAIEAAVKKVQGKSAEVGRDLAKLVVTPSEGQDLTTRAAADRVKIGKPDDQDEAISQAKSKYDTLIDGYQKKIDELQTAIRSFEGIPPEKLTPEQRQLQAGLNASLALYTGFATQAQAAATAAGQKAGVAYSVGLADQTQEGLDALREAENELARSESGANSPGYVAGLNASLSYWRARKEGLDKGAPEYLAAVKRVAELESKIRAEQGLSFGSIKASFTEGRQSGAAALGASAASVAKGFGELASPMAILAKILDKINPVGIILESMFSLLEEPLKALQEPMKTIGILIGSVLAPALELLAPIIDLNAKILLFLYDAIASFIKAITFGLVNIDRREPKAEGEDNKNQAAKDRLDNDKTQDGIDYRAGTIDFETYRDRRLAAIQSGLAIEKAAEIAAAKGNAEAIEEINRKYNLREGKEKQDFLNDLYAAEGDIAAVNSEAELTELDNLLSKKLISQKEYEARKLGLTIAGLERQRQAEIAAAEGDNRKILAINRKYDAQIEREKLATLGRLSEAFTAIGETLSGSVTGSIKDGLGAALRAGNFGSFRQGFAKNLKAAMFDAVLSAAIETAAFKALLEPAILALTDAFTTGDSSAIDRAIQGVLEAGNKVVSKSKEIYTALRPLRDAWGIKGDEGGDSTQTIEVVGNVSAPVLRVSLDMLAYLADSIKQVLPGLMDAINLHTPALGRHTEGMGGHSLALAANTAALPTFVQGVGTFTQATLGGAKSAQLISDSVDRMGQIVSAWGGYSSTHAQAMLTHARALGASNTPAASASSGGAPFTPKR